MQDNQLCFMLPWDSILHLLGSAPKIECLLWLFKEESFRENDRHNLFLGMRSSSPFHSKYAASWPISARCLRLVCVGELYTVAPTTFREGSSRSQCARQLRKGKGVPERALFKALFTLAHRATDAGNTRNPFSTCHSYWQTFSPSLASCTFTTGQALPVTLPALL